MHTLNVHNFMGITMGISYENINVIKDISTSLFKMFTSWLLSVSVRILFTTSHLIQNTQWYSDKSSKALCDLGLSFRLLLLVLPNLNALLTKFQHWPFFLQLHQIIYIYRQIIATHCQKWSPHYSSKWLVT